MSARVSPRFWAIVAGVVVAISAVIFETSRDVSLSAASMRRPPRPSAPATQADQELAPLPITLDGFSVSGPRPVTVAPGRPVPIELMTRTVALTIETDRFHDVRDGIDRLVADHRGSLVGIVASSVGAAAGAQPRRSLTATVTVPAAEGGAALAAARALGVVSQETPSAEDVTESDRLLRMRLDTARSEDRRLAALLQSTTPVADEQGVRRAEQRALAEATRLTQEEAALLTRASVLTIVLKIEASGS